MITSLRLLIPIPLPQIQMEVKNLTNRRANKGGREIEPQGIKIQKRRRKCFHFLEPFLTPKCKRRQEKLMKARETRDQTLHTGGGGIRKGEKEQ